MEQKPIYVLLVEDNPGDRDLIVETLEAHAPDVLEITASARLGQALDMLDHSAYDVVLSDLWLPDSSGRDTLRRLRTRAPGTPLIVLSGNEDEDLALQAVREGAQDFLVKGTFDGLVLTRALRYAIERHRAAHMRFQSA